MKHTCVLLGVALFISSGLSLVAADKPAAKQTCCEAAIAKGKECDHKCCIAAHRQSKSCEKCNPGKEDLTAAKKAPKKK